MKEITTLLFDIDGTLLDTSEFILQATEHALKTFGYAVPDRAIIKSKVGIPFPEYYIELTGETKNADKLVDTHREFQYMNFNLAQLFSGTSDTLRYLKDKGYKIAAVTSRGQSVHQTLKDGGIAEFFDAVITPDDTKYLKPHPGHLFKALEHLNELPEHAVMIGDSHFDIEAGKNAGTKTIRATYGFHADNLHDPEPDFIISDIKDLLKIL